jgi:chromosome partitioning protein
MSIIVVGSTKGGAGKSTLAFNIAVARANEGRDVLLVDGDEQRTAMTSTDIRVEDLGNAGYTATCLYNESITAQVRAQARKYDDIIIDAGGRDTGSLRAALIVAEKILIPVQPRGADVWAFDQTMKLIKETKPLNQKLKTYAVLNMADPVGGRDNEDTIAVINEAKEVILVPTTIVRRKAFASALGNGKAVTEYLPRDNKAIEELQALIKFVC